MKRFTSIVRAGLLLAFVMAGGVALADPTPFTSALTASDPTQAGRLSRDQSPSQGTPNKPFPGIINATTPYHFHAYAITLGADGYVFITFDAASVTTFISAYQSNYFVTNPASTYLGDEGYSGNGFGVDVNSFGFTANPFSTVILVVNETAPGAGLDADNQFSITAQSFVSSNYEDFPGIDLVVGDGSAFVVPEPETIVLFAISLAALGLASRRRRPPR